MNRKNKSSIYLSDLKISSLFFWPFSLFTISFGIYIIYNLIAISVFTEKNKVSVDYVILIKYFLLDLPNFILEIIPIILSISLVVIVHIRRTENYWLFIKIKGESPTLKVIKIWFSILLISGFAIAINEYLGKNLKQKADIVYDDELVRKPWLEANVVFDNKKFVMLNKDELLYFSKTIIDSANSSDPFLVNLFLWHKPTKTFSMVNRGNIRNGKIIGSKRYVYTFPDPFKAQDKFIVKPFIKKNFSVSMPHSWQKIRKMQTIPLSSLTLRELIYVNDIAKLVTKKDFNNLINYYIILYLLLPLVSLGISYTIIKI